MIFEYGLLVVASFLVGFLVKFVDFIEDDLKNIPANKFLKKSSLFFGLVYGLILVLVLFAWPILIPLAIGTILGEVISKKIDAWGHISAMFIFIILCFILVSLGEFDIGFNLNFVSFIILFFAASMIDELVDHYRESSKIRKSLSVFLSFRPFLEVTALTVSLLSGQWMIWLTVFSFDLAYILATRHLPKIFIRK